MDTTKEAYKQKMEAQLKVWSLRLEGLKVARDMASAEAKIQLAKQAEELHVLEVSARKHLAEVEASAQESWLKLKAGFEHAWGQLAGSVEALWAKIAPESASKR